MKPGNKQMYLDEHLQFAFRNVLPSASEGSRVDRIMELIVAVKMQDSIDNQWLNFKTVAIYGILLAIIINIGFFIGSLVEIPLLTSVPDSELLRTGFAGLTI